jgi:hypothetical protein
MSLEVVPDEIIVRILSYLEPISIIRVSSVDHQWRRAISTNEHLWKKICYRTWKRWQHLHPEDELEICNRDYTRSTMSSTSINPIHEDISRHYPFHMAPQNGFYSSNGIENIWAKIFVERYMKDASALKILHQIAWNATTEYEMINTVMNLGVDVYEILQRVLSPDYGDLNSDLTFKFYVTRVLYKMHGRLWLNDWKNLLQKLDEDESKVTMLDGAILFFF